VGIQQRLPPPVAYPRSVPPLSTLPFFAGSALALLVIPGPAVFYITTRSASQGRRAGLVSVLGVHTGTFVHVLAAVVGLSALLVASAVAFSAIKLAGALYLIVLGVRTLLGRRTTAESADVPRRALRRLYLDGVVVNVLNPKTALFFLAFLPQFVRPGHGPVWTQTLVLGLVFMVLGMMSDTAYAIGGAHAGRWFSRRRGLPRGGRYVEGVILVGLGLTAVAIPHRRAAA
jgi:threonine/homoserine/homoserine lactone efflux protein